MLTPHTTSPWTGFLRYTFLLLCALVLFSIITFALAAAYVTQLYKAPLDHSVTYRPNPQRWSVAWFIFYAPFLPFISTLHTITDTVLFALARPRPTNSTHSTPSTHHRLNPIYALTGATIFLLAWVNMMWIWYSCDGGEGAYDMCYQSHLKPDNTGNVAGFVGVSGGLGQGLLALGTLVLVGYFFYIPMAAVATHRARMAKRVEKKGLELKVTSRDASMS